MSHTFSLTVCTFTVLLSFLVIDKSCVLLNPNINWQGAIDHIIWYRLCPMYIHLWITVSLCLLDWHTHLNEANNVSSPLGTSQPSQECCTIQSQQSVGHLKHQNSQCARKERPQRACVRCSACLPAATPSVSGSHDSEEASPWKAVSVWMAGYAPSHWSHLTFTHTVQWMVFPSLT